MVRNDIWSKDPVLAVCCSVTWYLNVLSRFSAPSSVQPYGLWLTKLLHLWDFPGKNTRVGCCFLFQGIFLTHGSNPHLCLLHCRQVLYPLSHRGSPGLLCCRSKWLRLGFLKLGISYFSWYVGHVWFWERYYTNTWNSPPNSDFAFWNIVQYKLGDSLRVVNVDLISFQHNKINGVLSV